MFSNAVKQLCFNASLFRGNCLELRTGAFVQYEKVLNAGVLLKNMCGDIIAWKTVVFRITSTNGVRNFHEAKPGEIFLCTSAISLNITVFLAIMC